MMPLKYCPNGGYVSFQIELETKRPELSNVWLAIRSG